jgi:hypothetical protein
MRVVNPSLFKAFNSGTVCEWCRRPADLDCHHIITRSRCRLDVRINLIGLCRGFYQGRWISCHDDAGDGGKAMLGPDDLWAVVAVRENCIQSDIRAVLEAISLLPKSPRDDEIKARLEPLTTSGLALFRRVWEEITGVRS